MNLANVGVSTSISNAHVRAEVSLDAESRSEVMSSRERPQSSARRSRSTLNAEIKRRTNVVGIFSNDAAVTRLVGAMLLEQNDEWSLSRRYMQLEGLQTLTDTAPTRLPAVQR